MIRLTIPSIEEEDLQAVCEVLSSGYLVQGARVAAFEDSVASYLGTKYAVAVSNCTAALHLALLALDVRPGDVVVVTAYSWISTANVIELCGAQPVFVDIQPDTFNIDSEHLTIVLGRLMSNVSTACRVKAILPVHTFGQIADMPAILELTRQYNIPVIEDAACALGAALQGKPAGTWGVMGCFSFHPRKAITTGEGGIITTDDDRLARHLRALRNHGINPESPLIDFVMPGFNYRMTEFQAGLGQSQMAKLDRIISARRRLAAQYDRLLVGSELQAPVVRGGNEAHVYQSYVVLLPERVITERQKLIKQLKENGVETTIGTWHIPMTNYFRSRYGYRPGDFPATDAVFARTLTLPLFEKMPESQQEEVVEKIFSFIEG